MRRTGHRALRPYFETRFEGGGHAPVGSAIERRRLPHVAKRKGRFRDAAFGRKTNAGHIAERGAGRAGRQPTSVRTGRPQRRLRVHGMPRRFHRRSDGRQIRDRVGMQPGDRVALRFIHGIAAGERVEQPLRGIERQRRGLRGIAQVRPRKRGAPRKDRLARSQVQNPQHGARTARLTAQHSGAVARGQHNRGNRRARQWPRTMHRARAKRWGGTQLVCFDRAKPPAVVFFPHGQRQKQRVLRFREAANAAGRETPADPRAYARKSGNLQRGKNDGRHIRAGCIVRQNVAGRRRPRTGHGKRTVVAEKQRPHRSRARQRNVARMNASGRQIGDMQIRLPGFAQRAERRGAHEHRLGVGGNSRERRDASDCRDDPHAPSCAMARSQRIQERRQNRGVSAQHHQKTQQKQGDDDRG